MKKSSQNLKFAEAFADSWNGVEMPKFVMLHRPEGKSVIEEKELK
ncbi:MAG: hypothetical protein CM1200mP27_06680 [Chloroflexota bacterium]|nr:MAG: hypothetical protein CM1200mP27_06680 [Chloroflexota bacterium]